MQADIFERPNSYSIKIIKSGAWFSEDKTNRYVLWRIWDESKPLVMVIGLNPSTANETKNDNTITKVIKVANYNGFGGVYMMNLFSQVTPYPKELCETKSYIPSNDYWLTKIEKKCDKVVFAWGNFKEAEYKSRQLIENIQFPYCFVQNKNGSPRHPLYCLDTTAFQPFYKP